MSRSSSRTKRGFTLLEVLVALVIIGVALAAAMRGALSLAGTAEETRYKLLATLTAENRLYELRLARQRLELGQNSTDCEQGGVTFVTQDEQRRQYAEMLTVLPTNQ